MDELDLGIPPLEPEKPKQKPKPDPSKVRWVKYRPKDPVHCDHCLKIRHAAWPTIHSAPGRAVFKRTQGDQVTFYCAVHAEEFGGRYAVKG